MKATRYFEEQVLRKRPYLSYKMCETITSAPFRREDQEDGRVRFWGQVGLPGEAAPRWLRVVTLGDGETIHNAFIDRNFREDEPL